MASRNKDELELSAEYKSPTNEPFKISNYLTAPPSGTRSPTVPDKTAYLANLRHSVGTLQEQVNKELTRRMDEDKAQATEEAAKNGDKTLAVAVDEGKEEENYSEKVQEEED